MNHENGTGAELAPFRGTGATDTSYEVALDDAPGQPEPVTGGAGVALPALPGDRLPVIPAQLQSPAAFRAWAAPRCANAAHGLAFHSARSPWYLLQAVFWAAGGLILLLARQIGWWWVAEQTSLRRQAVADLDADQWVKLHNAAVKARTGRGLALAAELTGVIIAMVLLAEYGRWWPWAVLAVVAVPLLARYGKPSGRPVITHATTTPRFRILNADIVLRAYYAAGLGHPDKPDMQVTFGSPMSRDGEGSGVDVDLPYGKGLDDVINAKSKLASGLDVTVSQVFLHRDPTSHRRHRLWVADRDPLAVPVGRTPLLACKPADIWKPAPLGLDERGRLVTVPLIWNSVLVGALPRQGKTFSARLLALYAALDPYVKLDVFDGKGSPDWRKFALVADSCAFGLTPTRDGLPPEILLATLNRMKADVQERYHRLSELDPKICPEGKLTREIARDPRFGMPVRGLILDEFQEYYDLGDMSKEIAGLITFMVKVAPGAGIFLIGATQKPSGVGSGQVGQQFINARDQFQIRFSLRTSSWQVSEMVLGQGAYSEGLDSSALLAEYKGVGILRGATDASPTVRTYLADGQDAEKILIAARQLRERAGTLSGMAAGEDMTVPVRDVVADVLEVFGSDSGLQWQILAERLNTRIPERWADTTGEALSAECRAQGIPSVDVKQFGRALKGCRRADVEQVARSR